MTTFTVPGKPIPKGRPRLGRSGVYTPSRTKQHEDLIAWRARAAGVKPTTGPVHLEIDFEIKGKVHGDLDNLVKTVMDGLNGIAYADDRQVVKVTAALYTQVEGDVTRVVVEEVTR